MRLTSAATSYNVSCHCCVCRLRLTDCTRKLSINLWYFHVLCFRGKITCFNPQIFLVFLSQRVAVRGECINALNAAVITYFEC